MARRAIIIPGACSPDPESTGTYKCHHCGNGTAFIGIDEEGCPGDECDECGERDSYRTDDAVCEHTCRLVQSFDVDDDGEIEYHAFSGGGSGAEIGNYTAIACGTCSTLIYSTEPGE